MPSFLFPDRDRAIRTTKSLAHFQSWKRTQDDQNIQTSSNMVIFLVEVDNTVASVSTMAVTSEWWIKSPQVLILGQKGLDNVDASTAMHLSPKCGTRHSVWCQAHECAVREAPDGGIEMYYTVPAHLCTSMCLWIFNVAHRDTISRSLIFDDIMLENMWAKRRDMTFNVGLYQTRIKNTLGMREQQQQVCLPISSNRSRDVPDRNREIGLGLLRKWGWKWNAEVFSKKFSVAYQN